MKRDTSKPFENHAERHEIYRGKPRLHQIQNGRFQGRSKHYILEGPFEGLHKDKEELLIQVSNMIKANKIQTEYDVNIQLYSADQIEYVFEYLRYFRYPDIMTVQRILQMPPEEFARFVQIPNNALLKKPTFMERPTAKEKPVYLDFTHPKEDVFVPPLTPASSSSTRSSSEKEIDSFEESLVYFMPYFIIVTVIILGISMVYWLFNKPAKLKGIVEILENNIFIIFVIHPLLLPIENLILWLKNKTKSIKKWWRK